MDRIIRLEVQATPTINMFGESKYYWKAYQIAGGTPITLIDGYEDDFYSAVGSAEAYVEQYI